MLLHSGLNLAADLHMHSRYSPDGEIEVREVIKSCKNAGLSVVSLTDHNLVKGTAEALEIGRNYSLRVLPGIEIDCNYGGTDLHLLGYNINWESPDFTELEDHISRKVMDSFASMLDNLARYGIEANAGEILNKAEGRLPTAELIAEVLLNNPEYDRNPLLLPYRKGGERGDMPYINFYLDFFAQGKPAYVKIDYMDYREAIALIKKNNGVPVVAHPGQNLRGREALVEDLLDHGAEGLETFNNYHDNDQIAYFAHVAMKRKVLMTCGSDFHGKTKPLIKPGIFRTIKEFERYVAESIDRLRLRSA